MNNINKDFSKTLKYYLIKDSNIVHSEALNNILDMYQDKEDFFNDISISKKNEIKKEIIKDLSNKSLYDVYRENVIRDIIESFEIYGEFLNNIQIKDREEACKSLEIWVNEYVRAKYFNEVLTIIHPKNTEPSKEIAKDLKIIKHFENMLKNKINLDFLKNLNKNEFNNIEDIFNKIDKLKNDLESKEFSIFCKYKYYQYELVSKSELKNILKVIIKEYDLKNTSLSAKQLIDNI